MGNGTRTVRINDNLRVTGVPQDLTEDQKIAIRNLENSSARGDIPYQQVIQSMGESRAPLSGTPEQREQLSPPVETPPQVDLAGLAGEGARGLAPASAKAALGATFGTALSPIPGMNPATGAALMQAVPGADRAALQGMNVLNRLANTVLPEGEQMPQYADIEDFMNQMDVAEGDTQQEEVFGRAMEYLGEAGAIRAIGGLLQRGAQIAPTILQKIGNFLTGGTAKAALTGAAASAYGEEAGGAAAEALNAGPVATDILRQAGGMGADILAGGASDVSDVLQATTSRRAATSVAPTGQRSPYSRSELEIDPYSPMARQENLPEGVNPTASTQGRVTRQGVMESMPGGTGEFQFRRFNENKRELMNVMDSFGVDVNEFGNTPYYSQELMDDFIQTRGARLAENVDAKRDIIERFTGSPVPVNSADEYLAQELATVTQRDTTTARRLAEKIAEWQGAIANKDFATLEATRKDLFDEINSSANEDIRTQGSKILNEAYSRIVDDMGEFLKQNGTDADYNQWAVANRNLANMAQDYNSKALSEVLEEWDKAVETMRPEAITDQLFSMDRSAVEQLYEGLSEEGRATARQALIGKFAETQNTNDMSPTIFARNLRDYGEQVGIFFTDEQVDYLKGLKQHFDITRRAEEMVRTRANEQGLPTSTLPGAGTLVSMGVRGNPVVGFGLSLSSLGGLGKAARIYEQTPQIQRMLRELATLEPDSQAARNLSGLITRAAMRAAGIDEEEGQREQSPNRQTR